MRVSLGILIGLIACITRVCLFTAVMNGTAIAQPYVFDPSVCPTDAGGKVLVRLTSGLAFRFDPDGFLLRGSLPSAGPNLPPEGCPGNPIVTASISFPFQYNAALRAKEANTQPSLPAVSLLTINSFYGGVSLQDGAIRRYKIEKEAFKNCRITEEGLDLCYSCEKNPSEFDSCMPLKTEPPEVWKLKNAGAIAIDERAKYRMVDKRPFVVSCLPAIGSIDPNVSVRQCEVHYELNKNLYVNYRFDSNKVGEDEFLHLDRMLTEQILHARAPEFDSRQ